MKAMLGLTHVALFVNNFDACELFYTQIIGMRIVWKPDADNVYLTSGNDNLALHRSKEPFAEGQMHLDHIGFRLATPEAVDEIYADFISKNINCSTKPKTHRDNARSFYCADPDGNQIQFIYLPDAMLGN